MLVRPPTPVMGTCCEGAMWRRCCTRIRGTSASNNKAEHVLFFKHLSDSFTPKSIVFLSSLSSSTLTSIGVGHVAFKTFLFLMDFLNFRNSNSATKRVLSSKMGQKEEFFEAKILRMVFWGFFLAERDLFCCFLEKNRYYRCESHF